MITKKYNFSTKDTINAKSASIKLSSIAGQSVVVSGAAICDDVDVETGETKRVAYLATESGVFGTISPTAVNAIDSIIDYMAEEQASADITVNKVKSNAGREFITLTIN